MEPPPGTQLGPYEVLALLGRGGMGTVYRARDARLGREVALKLLRAENAGAPERVRALLQEARLSAAVQHPNVLQVLDVGEHEGTAYVVSELLEGETLRTRLGPGPLSLPDVLDLAVQVAQGLAAAHAKDIVHGDLKPENVFITRDGHAKVLDFGLAHWVHPAGPAASDDTASFEDSGSAVLRGTAAYMSPEQVRRQPLEPRSDVFALGALVYEMATGRRAFGRPGVVETLSAVLNEAPPLLQAEGSGIPAELAEVLRRCLQKRPQDRFSSARDAAFAFEALRRGVARGRGRRTPWRALAAALLAAALVAAALAGRRLFQRPPAGAFRAATFQRGLVLTGRFLPDDNTIAYAAAWSGGQPRVYLARLDSVEATVPALPPRTWLLAARAGELAVRLPDPASWPAGTLARIPVQGGAPRAVAENVVAADWARARDELAIVRRLRGTDQIEFPIGTVLHKMAGWVDIVRISPDGETLAFLAHPVTGDTRGAVTLLDRAGTARPLSATWGDISGLAWSPDGKEVWFTAADTPTARALRAVDRSGRERLLAAVPGALELQDISPSGRVLITHFHVRWEARGRLPTAAAEQDLSWLEATQVADLSDDAKLLLFGEFGEGGGPRHSVYLRRADDAAPVRLGDGTAASLSPDGRSVLTVTEGRLTILPTGAGQPRKLPAQQLTEIQAGWWLPDGGRVLLLGSERGHRRLYVQDVASGELRAVAPEGVTASVGAVAPDGRSMAARRPEGGLAVYPLDGGEPRPLPGAEKGDRFARWAGDGRSYFVRDGLSGFPSRVWRVDAATGRRQEWLALQPPDVAGVTSPDRVLLTPDGRYYAYTYRRVLAELYVSDGLR